MKEELMKEVFSRLDALAAKLGVTAEYLFGLYVRQAPLEAIYTLMLIAAALISAALLLGSIVLGMKKCSKSFEDWCAAVGTVSGITFVVLLVASVIQASDVLAQLYNPEYWAVKEIISQISR